MDSKVHLSTCLQNYPLSISHTRSFRVWKGSKSCAAALCVLVLLAERRTRGKDASVDRGWGSAQREEQKGSRRGLNSGFLPPQTLQDRANRPLAQDNTYLEAIWLHLRQGLIFLQLILMLPCRLA